MIENQVSFQNFITCDLEVSKSFSHDLNLQECCISDVIFKFRNLATMLLNAFEKFQETPGVLV